MPNVGQVHLSGIDVSPDEVLPGGTVRVTVNLYESAEFVGPFGKLRTCNPPGLNVTGLEVKTVLNAGWAGEYESIDCIQVANLGTGELEVSFNLTAPDISDSAQKRNFAVSSYIESTKNDQRSAPISDSVTVSRGSAAEDSPDDENGGPGLDFSGLVDTMADHPIGTLAVGGGAIVGGKILLD